MEALLAVLSIVGFALTIYQVHQGVDAARRAEKASNEAKTASERAEAAARNVRGSLVLATTIADCVVALAMMDEIKVHHRQGNWASLPDLYSNLKRRLVSIRSQNDNLTEEQGLAIQGALTHFSTMESLAERRLANEGKPPNIPKLNDIVSEQIDKLHTILTDLQRSIRTQDHG